MFGAGTQVVERKGNWSAIPKNMLQVAETEYKRINQFFRDIGLYQFFQDNSYDRFDLAKPVQDQDTLILFSGQNPIRKFGSKSIKDFQAALGKLEDALNSGNVRTDIRRRVGSILERLKEIWRQLLEEKKGEERNFEPENILDIWDEIQEILSMDREGLTSENNTVLDELDNVISTARNLQLTLHIAGTCDVHNAIITLYKRSYTHYTRPKEWMSTVLAHEMFHLYHWYCVYHSSFDTPRPNVIDVKEGLASYFEFMWAMANGWTDIAEERYNFWLEYLLFGSPYSNALFLLWGGQTEKEFSDIVGEYKRDPQIWLTTASQKICTCLALCMGKQRNWRAALQFITNGC